jgi:hypothetical protein
MPDTEELRNQSRPKKFDNNKSRSFTKSAIFRGRHLSQHQSINFIRLFYFQLVLLALVEIVLGPELTLLVHLRQSPAYLPI